MRVVLAIIILGVPAGCSSEIGSFSETTQGAATSTTLINSGSCQADETPIQSCALENGNHVMVCSDSQKAAQFRYRSASGEVKVDGGEFALIPPTNEGLDDDVQILFSDGTYRYVLFERLTYDLKYHWRKGLVVLKDDELDEISQCLPDEQSIDRDAAMSVWSARRETFTYLTDGE